jgi:hypothetical protein
MSVHPSTCLRSCTSGLSAASIGGSMHACCVSSSSFPSKCRKNNRNPSQGCTPAANTASRACSTADISHCHQLLHTKHTRKASALGQASARFVHLHTSTMACLLLDCTPGCGSTNSVPCMTAAAPSARWSGVDCWQLASWWLAAELLAACKLPAAVSLLLPPAERAGSRPRC